MSQQNFIMIFKRYIQEGKDKLSPLELYIYCLLYRCRIQFIENWRTIVSIHNIHYICNCKLEGKRLKNQFDTILKTLISLNQKGCIVCNVSKETMYEETLDVTFPVYDKNNDDFFYKLGNYLFDQFDDREKLFIYVYIDSGYNSEDNKHYNNKLSYNEWSKLVGVTSRTIQNRIESMNTIYSVPRIYKMSGDYLNGTKKQDENFYYTRPNKEIMTKWNNFYDENGKVKKLENGYEFVYSLFHERELSRDEVKEWIKSSNWGRENADQYSPFRYAELGAEDYYLYRMCKDNGIEVKFMKSCEKIIAAKKELTRYDGKFEEWEEIYQVDREEIE